MEYYVYPDAEAILVKAIKDLILRANLELRVATKKDDSSNNQLILRYDGGEEADNLRVENLSMFLYVTDSTESAAFKKANMLASEICGLLTLVPQVSKNIKFMEPGSWSPFEEEGLTQVRGIITEALMRPDKKIL